MVKLKMTVLAIFVISLFVACGTERQNSVGPQASQPAAEKAMAGATVTSEGGRNTQFDTTPGAAGGGAGDTTRAVSEHSQSGATAAISLNQAETGVPQDNRKIIRNAELTVQAKDPQNAQHGLERIAETLGGFVVSTDLSHSPQIDGTANTTVNVVLRVPSARFAEAIEDIRKLDGKIVAEKVSGQDVTEEYIDLDARLKSKQALESQFLEIMKQAKKVQDALDVERDLSDVRAEIEQLEGRKRFLENQSSLSTITVHLWSTAPVITASKSGFLQSISLAFGDCIDTGAAIINGFIRILGVLIPVSLLVLLPIVLVLRFAVKRLKVASKGAAPNPNAASEA